MAKGTSLTDFLFPAPAERTTRSIIKWWEARRLPYNLIVGGAGVFTLGAVTVIDALTPGPSAGPPPLGLIVAYGVLANGCYLMGPVLEAFVTKLWGRSVLPIGPALYRMGLTFSVGLTLFPILLFLIAWVVRVALALV